MNAKGFDSVGLNYLLHCLPGDMESKSVVFDHIAALMNSEGVVFGSTLLPGSVTRKWVAKRLMNVYNRKGVFSNAQDDLESLERAMRQRFTEVSVEVVGCAALFSGRVG